MTDIRSIMTLPAAIAVAAMPIDLFSLLVIGTAMCISYRAFRQLGSHETALREQDIGQVRTAGFASDSTADRSTVLKLQRARIAQGA